MQGTPPSQSPLPEGGRPESSPAEGSPAERDRRFPLWQILPWTLLAAALLLLLPPLLRRQHPRNAVFKDAVPRNAVPRNAVPMQSAAALSVPLRPAAPPRSSAAPSSAVVHTPVLTTTAPSPAAPVPVSAAPVPLSVTLYSAYKGKHVAVGTPVTISVYAALPLGQSATLAVSYGKDGGPKSLLSLAQGSLSSTTWTPLLPGRYLFTASALDSRKNGVFSHPVPIFVDAPASAPLPVLPAPVHIAAKLLTVRPIVPKPHLAAKAAGKLNTSKPNPPKRRSAPVSVPYHVAAAVFPIPRIAATLAGALRGRGFHALVRTGTDGSGKAVYRVETGDFTRRADADTQVRLLKKDGYPAFLFQTH